MNSLIKSAIKRQMRKISSAFTRSGPTFWKIHNNKVLNNGKQRLYWTLNRVFLSYVALLVIGFMFLVLLSALCFPGTINNLKTDSVENSLRQKSKKKFSSIISSKEFSTKPIFQETIFERWTSVSFVIYRTAALALWKRRKASDKTAEYELVPEVDEETQ